MIAKQAQNPFIAALCEDGDNHLQARNIRNSISLTRPRSHRIICVSNGTSRRRNKDRSLLIKLTVTNNAVASVEEALSLSSNHGLSRTNPLERHYRDVLCGRVHTPQDDATKILAGRLALGI